SVNTRPDACRGIPSTPGCSRKSRRMPNARPRRKIEPVVVKPFLVRLRAAAVLVVGAAAIGHGYQAAGQWPPPLQTVAEESPVLAPAASMKTIFTPPGYRLELVASEPMIQDPILIDFDPEGRLWAIEMPGFMPDLPATTEREPTGRIVVLEDVDD